MLSAVPAPDLRVLYRNALATVCPSLGEGFDFSGVEAMRSGGIAIASDIPVHREIYDDAAVYFDPYSTGSLATALNDALYADGASRRIRDLRERGQRVSARYLPEVILPKWEEFLTMLTSRRTQAGTVARLALADPLIGRAAEASPDEEMETVEISELRSAAGGAR
jgi:glycosyltransferase involved in cell wall biosynthesis